MFLKFKTFILGIAAGMAISLGGSIFIVCKNANLPILGSFLFSVGLLLVCLFSFKLYTGKIGYVFENKKSYLLDLLIMYLGNLFGALICGYLLRLLSINNSGLVETINGVANNKLFNLYGQGKTWYSLIISGIFCGALVFISVDTFKKENIHIVIRTLVLVLCVGCFVALGFDHCIANMFYFAFGNTYFNGNILPTFLSILFVTIGNSIGSIITYFVFKIKG